MSLISAKSWLFSFLIVSTYAGLAWAKPQVEIKISQAKEVVSGKGAAATSTWVPTTNATPGDTVQYTLTYTNKGDEKATDAAIVDPIPKGTVYVSNSAKGDNAEVEFSNDGGKTFAPPVKLTYEIKGPDGKIEKRISTPSQYTHVRWIVKQILPGASGSVSFLVKVS